MATGDIDGNVDRLVQVMRHVRYPRSVYVEGAKMGDVAALLPLLHHALLGYSKAVAEKLLEKGYELHGKSDMRFVETAFKALRELFDYRPSLTPAQFLQKGYAERKLILVHDVVSLCIRARAHALRMQKLDSLKLPRASTVFMRVSATSAKNQTGRAVGRKGVDQTRTDRSSQHDQPAGANGQAPCKGWEDTTRRVWCSSEEEDAAASLGRSFDIPTEVSASELSRSGVRVSVDREHWASPVKESEQSARHPRLSTKDGESVLLEDTATRPEEQRKQGESSGTASAFNDHHQAIHPLVQNVLLLTNALQGMKERIGKVEIAAASALEKMAGHVCVLESRVRMLEHMVGAQRLERDSAAATSRPDEAGPSLSATSLGRAQGLVLQQPTSQSNKVPPSLSEDYGGPRTSDELTGTPHGSLVQSGINLKEWISTMEGRFAGTRDLLGSLSYGV